MQSAPYIGLRETTKAGYASGIETLRVQHGHRTIAGLSRERIVTGILRPYAEQARRRARDPQNASRRSSATRSISGGSRMIPRSGSSGPRPTRSVRGPTRRSQTFEREWSIGTKQRLAFALMLYTGQRRSDMHRMTWADVSNGTIRVVQQKTRNKLAIPLHRELLTVLAAADRDHVTIINTEYGKPFTVDGFSQWMRSAITAAGLPLECQPHGLRKAAGRRLAEAGCTAHEIMAVLGHKTLARSRAIYTRSGSSAARDGRSGQARRT